MTTNTKTRIVDGEIQTGTPTYVLSYDLTPQKMIDALQSRTFRGLHAKGTFKRFDDPEEGETERKVRGYCCLGVSCEADGKFLDDIVGEVSMQVTFENADDVHTWYSPHRVYLPKDHWLNTPVGKDTVQGLLININDSYLTIAETDEDNEEDICQFQPIVATLEWLCRTGIIVGNDGHIKTTEV